MTRSGMLAVLCAASLSAAQGPRKPAARPLRPDRRHRSRGHVDVGHADDQARTDLWPHYVVMMNRIGRERGWPPTDRAQFERECGPDGALCVGSPETVAIKIINTVKTLGLSRFDLKYSNGALPHDKLITSIELIGTEVAPRVRESLKAKG